MIDHFYKNIDYSWVKLVKISHDATVLHLYFVFVPVFNAQIPLSEIFKPKPLCYITTLLC